MLYEVPVGKIVTSPNHIADAMRFVGYTQAGSKTSRRCMARNRALKNFLTSQHLRELQEVMPLQLLLFVLPFSHKRNSLYHKEKG